MEAGGHCYISHFAFISKVRKFYFFQGKVIEFRKVMSVATMSQCLLLSAVLHVYCTVGVDNLFENVTGNIFF